MDSPARSDDSSPNSKIFSSSLWGFKENLLEALQKVSNFAESDANRVRSKKSVSTSSSTTTLANHNGHGRRRAKVRSIFGQPEVTTSVASLHRSKEVSVDSLDTLDSGQEMTYQTPLDTSPRSGLTNGIESGIVSGHETSFESSEVGSNHDEDGDVESQTSSINSWTSLGDDHSFEDENEPIGKFMRQYVNKIFSDSTRITQVEKSLFGVYSQTTEGRLYFSRYINEQRVYCKEVNESTFYSLVQYFAIVLFECEQANDFSPAKTIMNMCFTFYYEPPSSRNSTSVERRHYLYEYLTAQPIWRSINFWSVAFHDAVYKESQSKTRFDKQTPTEEARQQENTVFGLLGAFTYYIKEFGLSEKFCRQFLKKQAKSGNLSKEQNQILQQNVSTMYHR